MSQFIKQIHERRNALWEQAKELLDAAEARKEDLAGEEEQTWQRLNNEIDQIDLRVKSLLDAEQRTKDADEAFRSLLAKPETQERKSAEGDSELRRWARGEMRGFDVAAPEGVAFRDLTKGTATAGGNTVPTTFYGQLMAHLIEVSGIMSAKPDGPEHGIGRDDRDARHHRVLQRGADG